MWTCPWAVPARSVVVGLDVAVAVASSIPSFPFRIWMGTHAERGRELYWKRQIPFTVDNTYRAAAAAAACAIQRRVRSHQSLLLSLMLMPLLLYIYPHCRAHWWLNGETVHGFLPGLAWALTVAILQFGQVESDTAASNTSWALYGLLGPAAGVNKVVGKEGILGDCKFNCKLQIWFRLVRIG